MLSLQNIIASSEVGVVRETERHKHISVFRLRLEYYFTTTSNQQTTVLVSFYFSPVALELSSLSLVFLYFPLFPAFLLIWNL
jgi:hypothetical protein